MAQKVIKIGKSVGITLPKSMLHELGVEPGDKVTLEVDKKRRGFFVKTTQKNVNVSKELIDWTDKFIEKYRPALEALAKK